jgi:hypothetical protein
MIITDVINKTHSLVLTHALISPSKIGLPLLQHFRQAKIWLKHKKYPITQILVFLLSAKYYYFTIRFPLIGINLIIM